MNIRFESNLLKDISRFSIIENRCYAIPKGYLYHREIRGKNLLVVQQQKTIRVLFLTKNCFS